MWAFLWTQGSPSSTLTARMAGVAAFRESGLFQESAPHPSNGPRSSLYSIRPDAPPEVCGEGAHFLPDPARDPKGSQHGQEGKGVAGEGRGRERGRPRTHVLAEGAPREPGHRRDKSADSPAGRTRVGFGSLPSPLWKIGGLTRWYASVGARDLWCVGRAGRFFTIHQMPAALGRIGVRRRNRQDC